MEIEISIRPFFFWEGQCKCSLSPLQHWSIFQIMSRECIKEMKRMRKYVESFLFLFLQGYSVRVYGIYGFIARALRSDSLVGASLYTANYHEKAFGVELKFLCIVCFLMCLKSLHFQRIDHDDLYLKQELFRVTCM